MTLVRGIDQSPTKQKLVRSVSGLCKELGMMVVGEGVETRAERDILIGCGCDLLQGYLFARPDRPFPGYSW
jgi:EAL domain-containing protein (putative c-di-GMP-specific phosphodiesterase class I)